MSDNATTSEPSIDLAPEALTAAAWWADKLRYGTPLNSGDKSKLGELATTLAQLTQAAEVRSNIRTSSQIDRFEHALADRITSELPLRLTWDVIISVEFLPSRFLSEAAEIAGIDVGTSTFPWKTTMWIKRGSVKVSSGYGAEPIDLPIA